MNAQWRNTLISVGSVVLLFVIWEVLSLFMPPVILPHPTAVFKALGVLVANGKMGSAFVALLIPLFEGFIGAVVLGSLLGFLLGTSQFAARAIDPVLFIFYSLPHVALLPLIIVWFGIGLTSSVVFVFISAVFSMIVNTEAGVRDVDRTMLDVARSLGATRQEVLREVVVPSTLPFIFSGMRIAVIMSLVGVLISELFISSSGVGYMLSYFGDTLQLAEYFAPLILVSALGVAMKFMVDYLDKVFLPWKHRAFGGSGAPGRVMQVASEAVNQ